MVYPSLFSKHGAMCDGKVHCFEDGNGEQKKPKYQWFVWIIGE